MLLTRAGGGPKRCRQLPQHWCQGSCTRGGRRAGRPPAEPEQCRSREEAEGPIQAGLAAWGAVTAGLPATAPLPHFPGNRGRRRKQWVYRHEIPHAPSEGGNLPPALSPASGPLPERPQDLKMARMRTQGPECVDSYPTPSIFLLSFFPIPKTGL